MKEKQITAYFCAHCNKLYQRKHACITHEVYCSSNPDPQRACFSCIHLHKKSVTHYYDTYSGESYEYVTILHCKKLDKFVYPPKVEAKKNWFDLGDEFNEPMPKVCNDRDIGSEFDGF